MAKGISSVNGNPLPKIGEENFYEVGSFYSGTPIPTNSTDIKWKLFVEQSGGNWRELRGPQKTGRRVPFNFPQQWYGKKLLIEAYLHSPEMKSPPGIVVMPITGDRKIDAIGFFDSNWNALSETPKYGQTLNVRINTVSMLGETLLVSLWERDTYSDTGHDPSENTNIWGCERDFKVENTNGRVEFPLRLDPSWAVLANKGLWDMMDGEHEYYLLVKGRGAQTKYSAQRSVKDEVATPQNPPRPTGTAPQPTAPQPAAPSPSDAEQHTPITVEGIGPNPPAPNDATSPAIVKEVKVEGITNAYFAKKEFTRLTGKEDGEHEYLFGGTKANNNTSTAANKESVADAILKNGKVNDTLKPDKKYTTKEAIIAGLTADEYGKDTTDHKTVTFKTFKLGEVFKKITSAPLEDKVYLVVTSYFLEGETATITVKENDGLIKGSPDAVLPLSEISEAKMASTEALTEADRTEKTSFSGIIAKVETGKDDKGAAIISEMYIVPIQLRPKTDADLAEWKEKIGKGKKEGKYTYPASKSFTVDNSTELNTIAQNIAKNSNNSDDLKSKKLVVYAEDIIEILRPQHPEKYGDVRYTEVTNIPTYKKVAEELYLNVTASGEKDYNVDFLKSAEADFVIGGVCECEAKIRAFMRMIRKGEGTIDEGGYTRIVGGSSFADHGKNMSSHPRVYIAAHDSTAAGAYQITKTNWDDTPFVNWRTEKGINDFSTESQDIYAVYLITKKRKAFDQIINNQFKDAVEKCRLEWASLPGAGYNQREEKLETIQSLYNKFLSEELSGSQGTEAKLHIKPGFLKQYFGYDCCADDSSEICPGDRSQCFEYSDVVNNPQLNNQSNNVNKNRFHRTKRYNNKHPNGYYHTGTDILAPLDTDLMSMLCGEVIEAYDTGGDLGKIVTVKSKDKNGSMVYIRYCHLNAVSVAKNQKIKHGSNIGKSGNTGNAINILPEHYHVHIEASTDGVFYGGNNRIDAEQFMKTRFDESSQGNPTN